MEEVKIKNLNVGLLSVAFLFLFGAYNPMSNVQTVILDSAMRNTSMGKFYCPFIVLLLIHVLK